MKFTLSTSEVINTEDVEMTLCDEVNSNYAVIFRKLDENGEPTFTRCNLQDCLDLTNLYQIRFEVR